MIRKVLVIIFVIINTAFAMDLYAQTIDELRKLTNDDWLKMSTEERLNALGTANSHAENRTFLGDFGKYYDSYKKWGYDYYEMNDRYENYAFRGFENYNIYGADADDHIRQRLGVFGARIGQ